MFFDLKIKFISIQFNSISFLLCDFMMLPDVLCTAIAQFYSIAIKYFMKAVRRWEMLV